MPSEYRITCDTGRPEFTGQPAALRHNYSPRWISAAVESISGAAQAASALLPPDNAVIASIAISGAKPYVKQWAKGIRRTRTR